MNDAGGVSRGERAGSLNRDLQNVRELHARHDALSQRVPIDELGRDEAQTLNRANLVNGEDVWMIERRSCFGLLNKAPQSLLV